MKILIPVDFSKCAENAAYYGAALAKKIGAEIELIHIMNVPVTPHVMSGLDIEEIKQSMEKESQRQLADLFGKLGSLHPELKINYTVIGGYIAFESIEDYARDKHADYIVMGSRGAGGVLDRLFGSNTAKVISNSEIPVLVVPEYASFKELNNILYATDLSNPEKEAVTIVPFARLYNAVLHIFHVLNPGDVKSLSIEKVRESVIKESAYKLIETHLSYADDVEEEILRFIEILKADLLVMFTHELTFWEKLLMRSKTRSMAHHADIPLLAIRRS